MFQILKTLYFILLGNISVHGIVRPNNAVERPKIAAITGHTLKVRLLAIMFSGHSQHNRYAPFFDVEYIITRNLYNVNVEIIKTNENPKINPANPIPRAIFLIAESLMFWYNDKTNGGLQ